MTGIEDTSQTSFLLAKLRRATNGIQSGIRPRSRVAWKVAAAKHEQNPADKFY